MGEREKRDVLGTSVAVAVVVVADAEQFSWPWRLWPCLPRLCPFSYPWQPPPPTPLLPAYLARGDPAASREGWMHLDFFFKSRSVEKKRDIDLQICREEKSSYNNNENMRKEKNTGHVPNTRNRCLDLIVLKVTSLEDFVDRIKVHRSREAFPPLLEQERQGKAGRLRDKIEYINR